MSFVEYNGLAFHRSNVLRASGDVDAAFEDCGLSL